MRIEEVSIKNFCQHDSLQAKLGPGVIGIIGSNGSGKSNLLKAIKRAITGESGNPGKKEDDVRWDSEGGFVDVTFSVGGQLGKIHRDLKTARCKMEFGGVPYKTATEIDSMIYSIIGVQPKILADIVFVNQGQIEGILFQKPSERAKSLQSLFGTEGAERIREVIFDELQVAVVNSRSEAIAKLETQLAVDVDKPLNEATQAADKIPAEDDAARAHWKQLIEMYQAYTAASTQTNAAKLDAAKYGTDLQQANTNLQTIDKNVAELDAALKEVKPDVDAARKKLNDQQINKVHYNRLRAIEVALEACEKALKTPAPVCGVVEATLEADSRRLETMRADYELSVRIVTATSGSKECPTCRQPLDANHLAEHNKKVQELKPAVETLRASVNAMRAEMTQFQLGYGSWKATQDYYKKQEADQMTLLAATPDVKLLTDAEVLEAQEMVTLYTDTERSFTIAMQQRSGAYASVVQLDRSFQLAKQRAEEAAKAVGAAVTAEEYNQARLAQEQVDKNRVTLAGLRSQITLLSSQRKKLVEDIERYKVEEQQMEKLKGWREKLERARSLLHRDQLPNLVAQTFLKALNIKLAYYIDMFEVHYSAKIRPDLAIDCIFPGDRLVPAERLSGGEKVMLGIAFRFAVYDLFVSNLGLMVLDEPTAYLDDDRVESVFALLERVKAYSKSAGVQLIIVTHEQRLTSVFDRTIQL